MFIFADYLGERHPNRYLLSATSDARGKWHVEVELTPKEFKYRTCQEVFLFWHRAGHCCDFLYVPWLSFDESKNLPNRPNPRNMEFVLPSTKATLSVKALHRGAPLVNAIVRIANEHWPKLSTAPLKQAGDAGPGKRLDEILHPAAHTDEHGVARFDDLAPGTYRILSANRDSDELHIIQVNPEGQGRSGGYRGVPVRAGEDCKFTVAVCEPSNQAALQILQLDGKPASWETTVYEYYYGNRRVGGTGNGGWINDNGYANHFFGKPGLWRMYARDRGVESHATSVDPPCYEAAGVLAVSPLLENGPATVLTSRWVEREEFPRKSRSDNWRETKLVEVKGRVYHADGKTPAFAVRLLALGPKSDYALYRAQSDALGRFHTKPYHFSPKHAGIPTEQVMLAMLPGQCGATVIPISATEPSEEWSITLPKKISLHGRVTVGGKSTANWNNQFHVLAAYEGRGRLDELLSILISPDMEGSFELAGLTPGRYRVQASMDDIWLSSSVSLVVDADGVRSDPLTLDIGQPGVPSVVRCIDAAGEPVVGIKVELPRPTGPLTRLLWPPTFTSDGAGVINLPPLEVGRHILCVPSLHKPAKQSKHTITIQELTPEFEPSELKLFID